MAKPDEDIFYHVIQQEQLNPEEILFLDDGELNIQTAKKLGFNCYLVQDKEDFRSLFIS
jgi:putative hydrolase of the HAD superfamily